MAKKKAVSVPSGLTGEALSYHKSLLAAVAAGDAARVAWEYWCAHLVRTLDLEPGDGIDGEGRVVRKSETGP